ncbi:MAG: hypothetical protein ACREIW_12045 [Chthoniobacterales bacterium]
MSATELDDLKTAWQVLNRNLERQNALALQQFKNDKLTRLRSGLRPLVIGQVLQLICGVLLAMLGGSFWVDHIGVAHLMIYGISLHVYGIMFIIFAARDLFLVQRIDYAAPVLALQKQIAELRAWHLRAALWFGIAGCFIWIPVMLMIFYGLGADVWRHNPDVVGWLVVSAFFCLAILCGIVHWSRRPGREKFAQSLKDNSAGRSVSRAQAVLDEIARFEEE